jgi:hypothetical protein
VTDNRTNRLAARAIRRHARDADDQRYLMEMVGLVAPDGSVPPDDTRVYDCREIEA